MSPGCRSGSFPGPPRWSGCSPPPSGRTRWPSAFWPSSPGPIRPASSPATWIGPGSRLDFLRRYLSLYNEYAQSELDFVDDNTLALTNALHADDQPIFAFDTAVFDWTTYIEEVHCPPITAPVRRMDALRRKRGARPSTMKDLSKDTAGRQRAGDLRPRRHDHVHQRDRAVPVGPAARAVPGPTAGRGRPRAAQAALLPAGRTAGPGYVPARRLPALRRRRSGGPGGVRRHHVGRSDPQPAVARGRPPDPGAPRRPATRRS